MRGYLLMIAVPIALLLGSFIGSIKQRLDARKDLGLRLPSGRQALIALALFLVMSVLTEFLYRRWGLQDTGEPWSIRYSTTALLVRVAFVAFIYPAAEEIFFRGFIFGLLRRRFGEVVAIAGSSAAFTALHLQYDLRGMTLVLIDALFFALVRSRTNSTLLTIMLHVIGNSYAVWQRW